MRVVGESVNRNMCCESALTLDLVLATSLAGLEHQEHRSSVVPKGW